MDANALRGKRLLVVDDNDPSRVLLKTILTAAGATVDEATNGEDAVAAWGQANYDAALMDIQMPRLDGMEATGLIRAIEAETNAPRTIIIAVTAHAMAEHRQRCLDAGMDAVITKPIDPLGVIDEVAALLDPGE
ncbi:MAG: response regulator [Coriobacteriia bacterium]